MVKQPIGGIRKARVGPRTMMSMGQIADTKLETSYKKRKRTGTNWGYY